MGTSFSPAVGIASKVPKGVQYTVDPAPGGTTVGQVAVETSPGRSLKIESPFRSVLVVMLKGLPALATKNGLKRKPYFIAMDPPRKRRCRVSKEARP